MATRSSGLVVRCAINCVPRSAMMTRPPMSSPQRKTLIEAERGVGRGRPSRDGRWLPMGAGEDGGLVLGDRPPPGVRAIGTIIQVFSPGGDLEFRLRFDVGRPARVGTGVQVG